MDKLRGSTSVDKVSNYNRASDASVRMCGNQLLERLMSPSQKSQVYSRPHSHESFFSVFLAFIVFTYGHFVEYMNMHVMS